MFRLWHCKGGDDDTKTASQLALRWSWRKMYALKNFCVVGPWNSVVWAQGKDWGPSHTCMETEEASAEEEKGRRRKII